PPLLSQTGAFTNTPAMATAPGLLPYDVNVPLWSDGAVKARWMAVPNSGAPFTPDQQISFTPTGEWSFPVGTVFVKHFDLITDQSNPNAPKRRLETRLLVRDPQGSVYGVTYKWRPDNSDADLLTTSLTEDIVITNADHTTWTQTWYYPSPGDCLACHTPAANYVLGVKTRQLNRNLTYASTGNTDNELRTLNHIGLLNPAFDETAISGYSRLSAVTNTAASLEDRARSYIDANCAQCHRPLGPGTTFDARYDTPLTNQNIINALVQKGDLGLDNARIVAPKDVWRSVLYARMNTTEPAIKMPGLARNVIDTSAVQVIGDWINSLPGTPALAPPSITPGGGNFNGSVIVTLQAPDTNAAVYYTLDGSLPSTASQLYAGPFLLSSSALVRANASEAGFATSVATGAQFNVASGIVFSSSGWLTNGTFALQLSGPTGKTYVFEGSTNLIDWVPVSTNVPVASPFTLTDPAAANFRYRFYRAVELP
ncbi:MAG TPA: chitobiase/beta-hexosaminidase C-terminal domain-containing protein, partial [Verrucomicrobiae bacterium]|nr:chitobiase/beta-hexosaminidase C-terminal domain-containing protein [Verrucomicrobiae bacterium]